MFQSIARVVAVVQLTAVAVLLGAIGLILVGVAPTFIEYETFTVLSGSMEPTIPVGSLAVVQPFPTDRLRENDVITYRTPAQPDVLVTHRLLSIQHTEDNRLQFQTKGDANNVPDLVLVDPNAVLGKVAYHVPYAGYLGDFAKRPQGLLLFVGIPGILLGLDFLREKLKGRPRQAEEPALAPAPFAAAVPVSAPAEPSFSSPEVVELLGLARQALEAGHPELAAQASDRVIQLDPRNEDAWILKADCAVNQVERLATLRTAALINAGSERVKELLQTAEREASATPFASQPTAS